MNSFFFGVFYSSSILLFSSFSSWAKCVCVFSARILYVFQVLPRLVLVHVLFILNILEISCERNVNVTVYMHVHIFIVFAIIFFSFCVNSFIFFLILYFYLFVWPWKAANLDAIQNCSIGLRPLRFVHAFVLSIQLTKKQKWRRKKFARTYDTNKSFTHFTSRSSIYSYIFIARCMFVLFVFRVRSFTHLLSNIS